MNCYKRIIIIHLLAKADDLMVTNYTLKGTSSWLPKHLGFGDFEGVVLLEDWLNLSSSCPEELAQFHSDWNRRKRTTHQKDFTCTIEHDKKDKLNVINLPETTALLYHSFLCFFFLLI
jgi:hypothetical protein